MDGVEQVDPARLLGYTDPSEQPEATGVEKLVLKRSNLFLVANRLGDVAPAGARDLGLFLGDTRHLSGWRMTVQYGPPLCLSTHVSTDYVSQIDFTITHLHEGDLLGKEPVNYVHLGRTQLIDDALVERIVLTNYLDRAIEHWIELSWAADFADVFEIRGARRSRRGTYLAPETNGHRTVLRYRGLDGREYVTDVRLQLPRDDASHGDARARAIRFDHGAARVGVSIGPGASVELGFTVLAGVDGIRLRRALRPLSEHVAEGAQAYASWADHCARFRSSDDLFDRSLAQAIADLKALTVYHFDRPVISAGIPWYTCPFGRDALITGFEALLATPDVARDALRFLARLQGTRDDATRDEEPGKIAHEVRFGEMAGAGEVPHSPYYGSVDATPLFIILLAEYVAWTDDRSVLAELLPHAERALSWIEEWGDRDGDGFVEYERRTPKGLRNQGWKDSHDGVCFASGKPAEPPIALVEVQGYVVDAFRRMGGLYRLLGRSPDAERLEAKADELARRIDEAFWMPDKGTYAIALDREKRQVDAMTSNPGHLLFSRALPAARARSVRDCLLGPAMWSGWGIRTLARGQPAYNPLSYHNGTVWPHDNALSAMGMAYYELKGSPERILDGLWSAAQHFRDLRLPELFCGLDRSTARFPVHYPVACSPQAWASAAPFLLLRACLGLYPDAPARTLRVVAPELPPWMDDLTVAGVRVGPASATLRFTRNPGGTFVAVDEVQGGPVDVHIELRR